MLRKINKNNFEIKSARHKNSIYKYILKTCHFPIISAMHSGHSNANIFPIRCVRIEVCYSSTRYSIVTLTSATNILIQR